MRNRKFDLHVGLRLRGRRMAVGATQTELADAVGITYQQIQKYESGTSQLVSSRLYELASALEVPVSFFFEGFTPTGTAADNTTLASAEAGRLAHFYRMIDDRAVRHSVRALVRTLAR